MPTHEQTHNDAEQRNTIHKTQPSRMPTGQMRMLQHAEPPMRTHT